MLTAGVELVRGVDAAIPVPLNPWRELRRGFNQADDLACQLGLPVWRALSRPRRGAPQAGLPEPQRHANVRNAFRLAGWPLSRRPAPAWRTKLQGAVVLLVDDVMTTGATLDACSGVLLEAGVRSVSALTLARAVTGRDAVHRPRRRPAAERHR
jgi:ComF family protein